MLNEERIILMTQMASYEENEGRKNESIGSYFKGDYIGLQVIKSVVYVTIGFLLVFGMWVLYHFESMMLDIYKIDVWEFGKTIILVYLATVAVYALISYLVYEYRYRHAKKNLKRYFNNLKRLSHLYTE